MNRSNGSGTLLLSLEALESGCRSRRDDLVPIHRPLYIVTDDVVHPVCRDEEDPDCGLITRCYLQRLVLSQRVRYLREGLPGFLQAFIDSIHHTSEGRGLINARSGTGGVGATRGGTLHRFFLVRLLARLDQPYHHAIGHTHYPPCCGLYDRYHSKNKR